MPKRTPPFQMVSSFGMKAGYNWVIVKTLMPIYQTAYMSSSFRIIALYSFGMITAKASIVSSMTG